MHPVHHGSPMPCKRAGLLRGGYSQRGLRSFYCNTQQDIAALESAAYFMYCALKRDRPFEEISPFP